MVRSGIVPSRPAQNQRRRAQRQSRMGHRRFRLYRTGILSQSISLLKYPPFTFRKTKLPENRIRPANWSPVAETKPSKGARKRPSKNERLLTVAPFPLGVEEGHDTFLVYEMSSYRPILQLFVIQLLDAIRSAMEHLQIPQSMQLKLRKRLHRQPTTS